MKRMFLPLFALAVLVLCLGLAACETPKDSHAKPTEEPMLSEAPQATFSPTEQADVTPEPTEAPEEKPVVFTDPRFENAVRMALGVYGDTPLYPSELAKVKELDLSDKMLSEINDVAWFTGLERLSLLGNPSVTYIEYVGRLTNLTYLDLCSTGVSDLSALAGLTRLRTLRLCSVPATDLAPLAGLTSLTELEMDAYELKPLDVSPLAGLINLKSLSISTDDLAPLAGLVNLTSFTVCGGFSDLDALSGMTKLEVLRISGASEPLDITGLAPLTSMRQLMIQMAEIGSLEPLSGMKSLFLLSLNGVRTEGIAPLAGLSGCTDMFLMNCGITDLAPLYGLTGLKELDLSFNPLSYEQINELRQRLKGCSVSFETN